MSKRTIHHIIERGVVATDERASKRAEFKSPDQNRTRGVLSQVRRVMQDQAVDAFVLSTGDTHQSEYVSEHDTLLTFCSGFTGSSATIVVTAGKALLWTDGRYFLQATTELGDDFALMRTGDPGVPELHDWLLSNEALDVVVVGVDAALVSTAWAKRLQTLLGDKKKLTAVTSNPVAEVWGTDRPPLPANPVAVHPLDLAGESYQSKVSAVQKALTSGGAGCVVLTTLDEIAWLFNIRGSDIPYNPVTVAYAVVTPTAAHLFIDSSKLTAEVTQHLHAVELHSYGDIEAFLVDAAASCIVWADLSQLSWALAKSLPVSALKHNPSLIALPKSIKNAAELQGIREAHVRDGAALTAFLCWLDAAVRSGEAVTELDVTVKIEEFRSKMAKHRGPSFDTIAGYGSNGAIIHYKPRAVGCASLGTDSLFLLDSGAQYLDGTTDVTRTLHFGEPTAWQRKCYTLVLKGHLALATLVFPEGMLGSRIDSVCRVPLWAAGLDYNHGTGHGVGAYLNVHEGPQGIGFRKRDNEAGLACGMTTSNEPGYYEEGNFGIRIETVCIVAPSANLSGQSKKYCELETVTMVPIQTTLIDTELLTAAEIDWLNAYHARVRGSIEPLLSQHFPEALSFLMDRTRSI